MISTLLAVERCLNCERAYGAKSSEQRMCQESAKASEQSKRTKQAYLDHVLDTRMLMLIDDGFDPDQGLDLCVQAVGHELELTIRRNEGDRAVVLETSQAHALVKVDVLHLDGTSAVRAS